MGELNVLRDNVDRVAVSLCNRHELARMTEE